YSSYKDHPHSIIAWHGDNWVIKGCHIYENRGEGVGPYENCSGWLIEGNVVYDNHSINIYLDSEKGDHIVRNNLVYNTDYMATLVSDPNLSYGYKEAAGIRIANEISDWDFLGNYDPTKNKVYNIKVYNNIVLNCKGGIQAMQYANGYNFELYNSIIANNTIVNSSGGGGGIRLTVPGGVKFYNNVVVNTDQTINFQPDMKNNYIRNKSPFIDGIGLQAQHYTLAPDAYLCIDQGLDLSSTFTEDYFGISRQLQGSAFDLGAIEYIQAEITGIFDSNSRSADEFKLHPTIFTTGEVIIIESNKLNDTIMVQLFSVSGSLLFYNTKTFSNRLEIQTNSLKPGLYF
ncbi:MAG: right-handed parallel beta-helix repeat-containing protein, partial [Candidatus Cyclobacteriaceae bacterium M3_2C_046]